MCLYMVSSLVQSLPFYVRTTNIIITAHALIEERELNVAMYKSFNANMALIRGPGCSLESMGMFWLFGDERWRIPHPVSHQNRPRQNNGVKEKASVKKVVAVKKKIRPSLFGSVNRKASMQFLHQNQQRHYKEIRKIFGTRMITHSLPLDTEERKIQTEYIKQTKPYDDNKAKDEAYLKSTAHPSQFHSDDWKTRTNFVDPKKEANKQLEYNRWNILLMVLRIFTFSGYLAVLTIYTLGVFSCLLAQYLYFLTSLLPLGWLLNDPARRYDTLCHTLFTVGNYLCPLWVALEVFMYFFGK